MGKKRVTRSTLVMKSLWKEIIILTVEKRPLGSVCNFEFRLAYSLSPTKGIVNRFFNGSDSDGGIGQSNFGLRLAPMAQCQVAVGSGFDFPPPSWNILCLLFLFVVTRLSF